MSTILIASLINNIDWKSIWEELRQCVLWNLEWFDGTNWVSVKEDLAISRTFPNPNHCKFTLTFRASKEGNYRLTFAINKKFRDYIERPEKWQCDIHFEDIILTFDWSDCKDIEGLQVSRGITDDFFWFRIRKDNIPMGKTFTIDPSLVGTSTAVNAVSHPFQRKSFYANGRFWVFYTDGTNMVYKTSSDGENWSSATTVASCLFGMRFSIWFDGTYVHYARMHNYDLFYRRGTPNSDGSITWSADEQLVYDGTSSLYYSMPCITVDSNGYAWIGTLINDVTYSEYYPRVLKNAKNDGTWQTQFIYDLSSTSSSSWCICPIPLTNGKVYVIYVYSNTYVRGKLYTGSWGSEETITSYTCQNGYTFSAVAENDDVHLLYTRYSTNEIRYRKRVYGTGWGTEVLVQSSVESTTAPALSIDASGTLYCFWLLTSTDHVYYKKCVSGNWDSTETDWLDESTDQFQYGYVLNCFNQAYNNKIGLVYVTKTASPFNVKFAYLTIAAGQVYEIYVDAICQLLSTFVYETTYNISKEASVATQGLTISETKFNIPKEAVINALADVLVEVVTGIIEIFKEAVTTAHVLCQTGTAFNISQDATAQVLTQTLFELGIAKEATVKASTTNAFEITFTLPLETLVKADALSFLESTFHISPEATIKVLAEVAIIKPTEAKITRLFLVMGDLAIQIQGN